MVYPEITDNPIFGKLTQLTINDFFDVDKLFDLNRSIEIQTEQAQLIFGTGATTVAKNWDILIYADMARWEIQQRMRRNQVGNLGVNNKDAEFTFKYKQAFFIDWRICDQIKIDLLDEIDFLLDTNIQDHPKMVTGMALRAGLKKVATQPFRVVPFFDPGPWGGQWMKEVCDLDRTAENYAWGFDCVPEENSLLLSYGDAILELPSLDLLFYNPVAVLGKETYECIGPEFPIRFDFLDTMEGGNLSLQVHPLVEYIKEQFGLTYTQDESYYMLDVGDDPVVYLGLKEGIDPEVMIAELREAQNGETSFDAEKFVEKWKVNKHDHISIPAGTVHCSGKNSMVLEISATPYIFTFKLWDWGRMGLDNKPRPINIDHGKNVIQWDRTTEWIRNNLISNVKPVDEGDGWKEEVTGLHELEFIETRRHWFSGITHHQTSDLVNVLNLVEGREVVVESPTEAFRPFIVHYAETFIVPANIGAYSIRPFGESKGQLCATVKAFVRIDNLRQIDHDLWMMQRPKKDNKGTKELEFNNLTQ